MKFTNKYNLPAPLVLAVTNDPYSRGDSRWSCTQLINPTRITLLQERHDDEIVEDVSENIWPLMGKAGHAVLEKHQVDNAIQEERLFATVLGVRISGASDYIHGDNEIEVIDWKFTSVYTRIFGSRLPEYERQLNVYSWLWREHGFPMDRLRVLEIYRDWKKGEAKRRADYPPQAQMIEIPLWTHERQTRYISNRVQYLNIHIGRLDEHLPDCQPDEYWAQGEKWSVRREGNKSAIRNLDTLKAAKKVLASEITKNSARKTPLKPVFIQHTPARRARCEEYCNVAPFCNQWQDFQQEMKSHESTEDQSG